MTYRSVTWQADDELTSAKLQQMASNDDFLFQNTPQNFYVTYQYATDPQNNTGKPFGQSINATQLIGIYASFDTVTTTYPYFTFGVYFPANIFTSPPLVVATIVSPITNQNNNQATGSFSNIKGIVISDDTQSDHCLITVYNVDGHASAFEGAVNVIAIGS